MTSYLAFQFTFLILGWLLIFINYLFVDHENGDRSTSDTLRYFSIFCFAMSIVFAILSLTS